MLKFSLATAALAALLAAYTATGGDLPLYVPLSGFAMAAIAAASGGISKFLRIFIAMYGLGYWLLAGGSALRILGLLPDALALLLPPPYMATASVAFAAIVLGVAHIPVIRTIMGLADPYFSSQRPAGEAYGFFGRFFPNEGRAAATIVGIIIAANFVQVALTVKLNFWYRDLFDALEKKDPAAFWVQIWWVFVPLILLWIVFQLIDVTIDTIFQIRWREWLTQRYFGRWLADGTHYKMIVSGIAIDNPDQRIASDVDRFISQTMSLSLRLLSQLATLVSFTVVLWNLSNGFTFPGTDYLVPGFLVWVALVYSLVGTIITHLVGRPLIRLDFLQERLEANFRFSLARLREYGEQVALLNGADAEKVHLRGRFGEVIDNTFEILKRRLKLVGFSFSWGQLSVAFPYILMGSYYFAGKITLGQLQQGSSAFGRVEGALSFFINSYSTLASYKATVDRLLSFGDAMSTAEAIGAAPPRIERSANGDAGHTVTALSLSLPDGKTLARIDALTLNARERTLVAGPSGSGKSTLFRAIAGIWPFGEGQIAAPQGKSVMTLPQRPYFPLGTLRTAVSYPGSAGVYSDAAIKEALQAVKLDKLVDRLDEEKLWGQLLSGGEQQRLAIARALLAKPDWLFLDEATAALDEALEAEIYALLVSKLSDTTIVSIGHRSTLNAMHDRKLVMVADEAGVFSLRPA